MTLWLLALACAAAPAETPPPPLLPEVTVSLHEVPPLPEDVLVQEFFRDSGLTYRVTRDGRWLVTDPGQPETERKALPRYDDPGRVTQAGLERLETAIAAVPQEVPPGDEGRFIAFSWHTDQGPRTVEVRARPGDPPSHGALAELARLLGDEVYGTWMEE